MAPRSTRWWPLILSAATLACDGRDKVPVSPTSPTGQAPPAAAPAVTFLILDASSIGRGTQAALLIGQSHQMRSRGSTRQGVIDVDATWTSDNPAVLTTTPQGLLTGVSNGWATLIATYQNASAAIDVRVATDYGGTWPGTLRLLHCDAPDPLFCARHFPPGSQRPLQLSVVMDRLFAVVRFRWDADGTALALTWTVEVGLDGGLAFAGRMYDGRGFEAPLVVASWRSNLAAPDRMAGRVTMIHGLRDPARTEWELIDARRVR